MSITYPDHIIANRPLASSAVADTTPVVESAPYTPVYARSGKARNGRKAVKTWMILAPIGAVVLIGGGIAMAIGGETSEPLGSPVPVEAAPIAAPMMPEAAPKAVATPAPAQASVQPAPARVARQAVAPSRRASAVRPRVEAAPVVAPVQTAPPPTTGPQPYVSATEPAATAVPAPPTPILPAETVTGPPID